MARRRKVPAQRPDRKRTDLAGGATVNCFSSNIAYKMRGAWKGARAAVLSLEIVARTITVLKKQLSKSRTAKLRHIKNTEGPLGRLQGRT
jgi:hypothetical protein